MVGTCVIGLFKGEGMWWRMRDGGMENGMSECF